MADSTATIAEMARLLEWYVTEFPAFRAKPIGAPNSIMRLKQQIHTDIEDRARAAISRAGGKL